MSQLARPAELDQGIVLGWSVGRDPESRARAYLARWIPLLPGVKSGSELPVYTTVYEARVRRNARMSLLTLILAGPLGGLISLVPEGKYVGPAVVAAFLALGAAWWRRSPSVWERGPFVRLLGAPAAVEPPPRLVPLHPRVALTAAPPAPPPATPPPPPAGEPLPQAQAVMPEPPASSPPGPAVPRMPISSSPDWSARPPAPALKTPSWAPSDAVPSVPQPVMDGGGPTVPLPAWPPAAHPMGGAFETLIGTAETQPPAPAGIAPGQDAERERDAGPPIELAGKPVPNAELFIDGGPDAGRTHGAGDSPVTVGRAPDNDFVLIDPRTSRHHARIEPRGAQLWIVDLSSANGTLVNDERVSERALNHGDVIRIGQNRMSFRILAPELSLI